MRPGQLGGWLAPASVEQLQGLLEQQQAPVVARAPQPLVLQRSPPLVEQALEAPDSRSLPLRPAQGLLWFL